MRLVSRNQGFLIGPESLPEVHTACVKERPTAVPVVTVSQSANSKKSSNIARTHCRSDTLIEVNETFAPRWGIVVIEVIEMMHLRPSLIRLSLTALPCSATFAQLASERQGYAPASDK